MPSLNPSNLREENTFHTLETLYVLQARPSLRQRHWCLLGEITEIVPWPVRLCIHIRDMDNEELMVSFNDDQRGATFARHPNLKPGSTMAFLYPEFHAFMDGQTGLRIEQPAIHAGAVKILPYSMDTILKVNDQIWKKKGCLECQKCQKKDIELKRCSRCQSAIYCGKDCQTTDWKEHKKVCKVFAEVKWFTDKDWVSASVENFRF